MMGYLRWVVALVIAALIGLFGYSYSRNPSMGPMDHAQAVGFVLANPVSTGEWRGLACPQRRAVIELVQMSIAPKVCGVSSDGGAMKRAKKFESQGLGNCWALFKTLSHRAEQRWAPYITKAKARDSAVEEFCKQATALIQKAS